MSEKISMTVVSYKLMLPVFLCDVMANYKLIQENQYVNEVLSRLITCTFAVCMLLSTTRFFCHKRFCNIDMKIL